MENKEREVIPSQVQSHDLQGRTSDTPSASRCSAPPPVVEAAGNGKPPSQRGEGPQGGGSPLHDISNRTTKLPRVRQRKAVFFDRDGTLNVDVHYLHRPEDFEWLPGAREAIKYVNDAGCLAIVITNQSGVARGYFPESDVLRVYDWMNKDLESLGAHLDALYYCPHHPHGSVPEYTKDCTCRKPKPGLVLQAIEEHHIDPAASVLIGDGDRDVECAERAGVRGVKYEGGSLLEVVKRALHLFSIPSN